MKWFKFKNKIQEDIDKYHNYEEKLIESGNYLVELAKKIIDKYCESHPNFIKTNRKDKELLVDISDKRVEFLEENVYNINRYRFYIKWMNYYCKIDTNFKYSDSISFEYIKDNVYMNIDNVFINDVEDKKILCIKIKEVNEILKDDILDEMKVN